MTRFKLTIEYDGTGLAGWQRQNDMPSVQGHLEQAVERLTGKASEVTGAGRTDAGVHALSQVAHVDIENEEMMAYNVMHGMNYHLQSICSQIAVVKAESIQHDFHARFSATARSYFYLIANRQARLTLSLNRAWHIPEALDTDAMHAAAQSLLGHHDFTTFRSSECQAKSPVKTLDRFDVTRVVDDIYIHVGARSFLHHQVRNLVGTLRLIGNEKWSMDNLHEALAARDRKRGGETAPAHGLYLVGVEY